MKKHPTVLEALNGEYPRLRLMCDEALQWMREHPRVNVQYTSVNRDGYPYGGHGDTAFLTRMQFLARHNPACFRGKKG